MFEGLDDGALGDLVKDDALDLDIFEQVFLFQNVQHMPGNCLAFPVRISGQEQVIGFFDGVGYFLDLL